MCVSMERRGKSFVYWTAECLSAGSLCKPLYDSTNILCPKLVCFQLRLFTVTNKKLTQ